MANRTYSYIKTSDPTVNDDTNAGYYVDDGWMNTTTDTKYVCADNTAGAAVWVVVSGLAYNSTTVTTGNVSAAEENVYNLTIAGMTANRSFVLPAASVAGKTIRANVLDGDATYALVLIGNTGVTINGGSAATEWSRLFIAGESVTFESTSTSNWQVIEDGRIACSARIENTDSQNITNNSNTLVVLDELVSDNANIADTTNYRINIRRDGDYLLFGTCRLTTISAAATAFVNSLRDDSANVIAIDERYSASGRLPGCTVGTKTTLTAGQYMELYTYHNTGSTEATYVAAGQRQSLSLVEVFT